MDFEKSLLELETTVAALEKGDITLSYALELFEKGVKLSKECEKLLDQAEQKVKMVVGADQ